MAENVLVAAGQAAFREVEEALKEKTEAGLLKLSLAAEPEELITVFRCNPPDILLIYPGQIGKDALFVLKTLKKEPLWTIAVIPENDAGMLAELTDYNVQYFLTEPPSRYEINKVFRHFPKDEKSKSCVTINGEEKEISLKTHRAVRKACEFIESNYMKPFHISDIAVLQYISPNYLSSIFHRYMGITIKQYTEHYRLNKSREMLLMSDLPIKDIAGAAGFRNYSYFSRSFRKYYGTTPSDFRNKEENAARKTDKNPFLR